MNNNYDNNRQTVFHIKLSETKLLINLNSSPTKKTDGPTDGLDFEMNRIMGKPTICICENKDADQLRGIREADQCLCFRYMESTLPLLLKSKISSLCLSSVIVQPGLCQTCSEITLLVFPQGGSNGFLTALCPKKF